MADLDDVSTADLQDALDAVGDKKPAMRLLAAIAHKDGVTQQRLAGWFGVERKTIYNWLTRIDPHDIGGSVRDDPRPGRPRKLTAEQQVALAATLEDPPTAVGYDAETWTAPVLQEYVASAFDVDYSLPSCRRLLAEYAG